MPVARLLVEGDLDTELLTAVFAGTPLVKGCGPKYGLGSISRFLQTRDRVHAVYLRDRDFDFDPPVALDAPTPFLNHAGQVIGWRWCRHEMENYLLEPSLVSAATAIPVGEFEDALRQSAQTIRHLQSARWTVGRVRRTLPPHHELETRPANVNELALPPDMAESAMCEWALSSIATYRAEILAAAESATVESSLSEMKQLFDDAFVTDVHRVLIWFSGKNLMAGLTTWLQSRGFANAGEFRAKVRDWVRTHNEDALDLLPEWRALVQTVRSI